MQLLTKLSVSTIALLTSFSVYATSSDLNDPAALSVQTATVTVTPAVASIPAINDINSVISSISPVTPLVSSTDVQPSISPMPLSPPASPVIGNTVITPTNPIVTPIDSSVTPIVSSQPLIDPIVTPTDSSVISVVPALPTVNTTPLSPSVAPTVINTPAITTDPNTQVPSVTTSVVSNDSFWVKAENEAIKIKAKLFILVENAEHLFTKANYEKFLKTLEGDSVAVTSGANEFISYLNNYKTVLIDKDTFFNYLPVNLQNALNTLFSVSIKIATVISQGGSATGTMISELQGSVVNLSSQMLQVQEQKLSMKADQKNKNVKIETPANQKYLEEHKKHLLSIVDKIDRWQASGETKQAKKDIKAALAKF